MKIKNSVKKYVDKKHKNLIITTIIICILISIYLLSSKITGDVITAQVLSLTDGLENQRISCDRIYDIDGNDYCDLPNLKKRIPFGGGGDGVIEYIKLIDPFGGDVTGTYDAIVITDSSHLHDALNLTNLAGLNYQILLYEDNITDLKDYLNVSELPLSWENVTKPSDCASGQFVYGIDGTSLECCK